MNGNAPIDSIGLSPWGMAWARLRANRMAVFGLVFVLGLGALCFGSALFMPDSSESADLALSLQPSSAQHWLGTDIQGRDLLLRIIEGGRVSLLVGIVACLVSLIIGVAYGAVSGYAGGRTDRIMMRSVEVLYALPFSILVIVLSVAVRGAVEGSPEIQELMEGSKLLKAMLESSVVLIIIAICLVEWLVMARIVRSQVMECKTRQFVDASHTLGQRPFIILFKHILPNIAGPVIVYATLTIPSIMLLEAFVSFLGLGIQPPDSSWGVLIKEGAETMESYPWLLLYPSLFFSATLFSLNFLGDGLRDALDPRMTR